MHHKFDRNNVVVAVTPRFKFKKIILKQFIECLNSSLSAAVKDEVSSLEIPRAWEGQLKRLIQCHTRHLHEES